VPTTVLLADGHRLSHFLLTLVMQVALTELHRDTFPQVLILASGDSIMG
jgi:hypothetical protein